MSRLIQYVRKSGFDGERPDLPATASPDKSFEDRASIKEPWPALQECLRTVSPGDLLVVDSMDRVAHSVGQLDDLIDKVRQKYAAIYFQRENLVVGHSPKAELTRPEELIRFLRDFEHEVLRERQRIGIAAAKKRGAYKGRERKLNEERAQRLVERLQHGESASDLALEYGISRGAVYVYKERYANN